MAKFIHTYRCIQCRGEVSWRESEKSGGESGSMQSLFHCELALEKEGLQNKASKIPKENLSCLGRMVWKSSILFVPPDFTPVIQPHHPTIPLGNLPTLGRNWANAMRAGGNGSANVPTANLPATCSNNGQHITDPRTGQPKGANIGVYEYYIGGPAGDRATARSGPGGNGLELFWSTTHLANTYNYHLIV